MWSSTLCSYSISVVPCSISATAAPTDVSCAGSSDGALDLSLSGNYGNPTFSWTGPNGFVSTSEDLTGLEAGSYSVTATGDFGLGCSTTETYAVGTTPDVTPPVITCPADITVNNDLSQCGAVVDFSVTATDNCGLGGVADDIIQPNAIQTLTLSPVSGSVRIDVAYNPLLDLYYTVTGGSANLPIETFNGTGAKVLSSTTIGYDWRGIWWNPNTGQLEGNTCSACPAGIRLQDLNVNGYAVGSGTSLFGPNQPSFNSHGDYDHINDELIYYYNGDVYRVDHSNNTNLPTITLDLAAASVSTSNLNLNLVGYSGIVGSEYMVYDHTNERVLFFNMTGNYQGASQLPSGIPPTGSLFNTGFANGQVWLRSGITWKGYSVTMPGPALPSEAVSTPPSGSVFPVGVTTVTSIATDASGNTATCSFDVTVIDNEAPVLLTQDIPVSLDANGNAIITAQNVIKESEWVGYINAYDLPVVSGNPLILYATGVEAVADLKTTVDANAGTVTLQPNFTKYSSGDPNYVNGAVGNKIVQSSVYVEESGLVGQFFAFSGNVASNTLDAGYDNYAFVRLFDLNFNLLFEVRDPLVAGNSFSVSYDNTPANTVFVQYGFTVQGLNANPANEASLGSVVVNAITTLGDNCTPTTATVTPSSFDCSNVGPNTVTVTLSDANGNSTVRTAVVTIVDDIAPTAVAQDQTIYLDASGNASIAATQVDAGSSDNCGFILLLDKTTFDCSNIGANNLVTLTAKDAAGNIYIQLQLQLPLLMISILN